MFGNGALLDFLYGTEKEILRLSIFHGAKRNREYEEAYKAS